MEVWNIRGRASDGNHVKKIKKYSVGVTQFSVTSVGCPVSWALQSGPTPA